MRLTILQMMKLVVACALASAYVLPLVRLAEAGVASWSAMILVGAIGIPLVFALVTIVLARKGPLKVGLVRVLTMTSFGVALGFGTYALMTAGATWIQRGVPTDLHSLMSLAVVGLPVIVLDLVFIRLLRRVVSGGGMVLRGLALAPTPTDDRQLAVASFAAETTAERLSRE